MPYTQEQYDALQAAIASGALTVEYADKKVTYRSLNEMNQILGAMAADLGTPARRVKRYSAFSSGNFPTT